MMRCCRSQDQRLRCAVDGDGPWTVWTAPAMPPARTGRCPHRPQALDSALVVDAVNAGAAHTAHSAADRRAFLFQQPEAGRHARWRRPGIGLVQRKRVLDGGGASPTPTRRPLRAAPELGSLALVAGGRSAETARICSLVSSSPAAARAASSLTARDTLRCASSHAGYAASIMRAPSAVRLVT